MRKNNRLLAIASIMCILATALMLCFATENAKSDGPERVTSLFIVLAVATMASAAWCLKMIFRNIKQD